MKKFTTCSDGGSFLFGNKDFAFKLSNNFGDCDNTVLLFDTYREFDEYCKEEYGKNWHNKLKWIMPINGEINLYNYDCSDMKDEDITVELGGYYDIYLYNDIYEYPTLAIVKDEERQHI